MSEPSHHRRTIVLSTIAAVLTIGTTSLPVMRYLVTPWLVAVVKDSMGEEITQRTTRQVQPLGAAFKVIIESNIRQMEQEVGALEWRRDNQRSTWTQVDAGLLVQKLQALQSQKEALAAIVAPPPK